MYFNLCDGQVFHCHNMILLNKVECYSQVWNHIPTTSLQMDVGNWGSHPKKKCKGKIMQRTFVYWIDIPWPTMTTICPDQLYAPFVIHIFINFSSPFVSFFQTSHQLLNDHEWPYGQSKLVHTISNFFSIIICLDLWTLLLKCHIYSKPSPKMHK
jgi:hypothetical protein